MWKVAAIDVYNVILNIKIGNYEVQATEWVGLAEGLKTRVIGYYKKETFKGRVSLETFGFSYCMELE